MTQPAGMTGLLYALSGYLVLQVGLNLFLTRLLTRLGRNPRHALTATFWSGVVNALYLGSCGVLLIMYARIPWRGSWPLYYALPAGVAAGVFLWYVSVLARKFGIELFGKGRLIAAEDAILAVPPRPAYVWFGIGNLAVVQPLGREVFFRAAMLPLVATAHGWPTALLAVLLVELLLKLNLVWVFAVSAHSLLLGGLYYLSGSVPCCVTTAAVAGLIHAMALNRASGFRRVGGGSDA